MIRKFDLLLIASVALAACEQGTQGPAGTATFVVDVEGEQFRVRVDDATTIAQGRALLASGQSKNVSGEIARGSGGFNTGYNWHLRPGTVEFVDLTIELCDGMPSYVEENVDYYVDTVKRYCPWGARVIGEVGTPQ